MQPMPTKGKEIPRQVQRIDRIETAFDAAFAFTAAGEILDKPVAGLLTNLKQRRGQSR
ncbi:MAG: hypothetical protein ACREH8_20690 [Opitutaceae bacterium]